MNQQDFEKLARIVGECLAREDEYEFRDWPSRLASGLGVLYANFDEQAFMTTVNGACMEEEDIIRAEAEHETLTLKERSYD